MAPIAAPKSKPSLNNVAPVPQKTSVAQPIQPATAPPAPAPDRPASTSTAPPVAAEKESAPPAPIAKEPEVPVIPSGTVSVSFPPFPSIRVPAELKSQSSKIGTTLQIGQLISRVTPPYPEDLRRQRMEGTVKLHAVVGKDGAVQSVKLVSGQAILAAPAINAIVAWRYNPTLFGGQAIETEQDITVVFRLQNQ